MRADASGEQRGDVRRSRRAEVRLAGWLLVAGLLINIVATLFHPGGAEDNHPAIFTKYANSDPWVAVHLGQFVGVLMALGGLCAVSDRRYRLRVKSAAAVAPVPRGVPA